MFYPYMEKVVRTATITRSKIGRYLVGMFVLSECVPCDPGLIFLFLLCFMVKYKDLQ